MARIHLIDGGDQVSCRRGAILFQRGPVMRTAAGLPPARTILLLLASGLVSGCSAAGAPSFDLFGAFFPAWLFCGVLGVVGAGAARGVFVASGLSERLPYQLFVCTAIGVLAACLAWLIGFGW
jgi:YtcA family